MRRLPREARRRIALAHAGARRAEDISVAFVEAARPGRRIWLGFADLGGVRLSPEEAEHVAGELIAAAGQDRSLEASP